MNKEYIIKSNDQFDVVIKQGTLIRNRFFKAYKLKNKNNHIRFGISVPKSSGIAVIRNKTKRQVKEILRNIIPEIEGISLDVVIILNKNFISSSFSDKINIVEQLVIKEIKA